MTGPEHIVTMAEAVYRRRDADAAAALFAPDAVIVWNGREVARGDLAVLGFHQRFFAAEVANVELSKTLIAAEGEWVAAEWRSRWDNPDGSRAHQVGAEHWRIVDGLIAEWRAYAITEREDG